MQVKENFTLDALDRRILRQLQENADLSNQALAERVHASPPTCLRRVQRLKAAGIIERQVALLDPARLGSSLTAIVELTLDRQGSEYLSAFEALVATEEAIEQCYRVSPGPDFVLVLHVQDMAHYHALAHRLFAAQKNIRNVRAFFSVARSKFAPRHPV